MVPRVDHGPRPLSSNNLVRSISPVSHSNLTIASHTGFDLGFVFNDSVRIFRAPSTFLTIHCSFARTSQKISRRGNFSEAVARTSSRDYGVPRLRSSFVACNHMLRLVVNSASPCASIAWYEATNPLDSAAAIELSAQVCWRSSPSTSRPTVCLTMAAMVSIARTDSDASLLLCTHHDGLKTPHGLVHDAIDLVSLVL